MKIMVSACLAGENCKYNGGNNRNDKVLKLMDGNESITVCPEQMGGLPTPRTPSERIGDKVMMQTGTDVTAQYRKGAEEALGLYRLFDCDGAILKARSPSCGLGRIYDGTFSGKLTARDGVTAELLKAHGIPVWTEEQVEELLK